MSTTRSCYAMTTRGFNYRSHGVLEPAVRGVTEEEGTHCTFTERIFFGSVSQLKHLRNCTCLEDAFICKHFSVKCLHILHLTAPLRTVKSGLITPSDPVNHLRQPARQQRQDLWQPSCPRMNDHQLGYFPIAGP